MRKRGMAIPVVLAFMISLTCLGMFVFSVMRRTNLETVLNSNQMQAHFIARAGMEHALLKVRVLSRELYDSACLAQGRNPLFDFSKKIDANLNPGPMFLFRESDAKLPPKSWLSPDLERNFASRLNPPGKWLQAFIADLNSGKELSLGFGKQQRVNGVMSMEPLPEDIRSRMIVPFRKARYEVDSIQLPLQETASGTLQEGNVMILDIAVSAEVTSAQNETWKQTMRRTVRVTRDARQ